MSKHPTDPILRILLGDEATLRQAAHAVLSGVWCGVAIASDELPIRADVLVAACRVAGAEVHTSDDHGLEPLLAVHDARFVETLATAYQRWVDDGHLVDPGAEYVTAYVFPSVAGVHGGDPARPAATIRAEIGRFAMDTMTTIGPVVRLSMLTLPPRSSLTRTLPESSRIISGRTNP